jgi:hypothetical protein
MQLKALQQFRLYLFERFCFCVILRHSGLAVSDSVLCSNSEAVQGNAVGMLKKKERNNSIGLIES